jgi:hypothetical protein
MLDFKYVLANLDSVRRTAATATSRDRADA